MIITYNADRKRFEAQYDFNEHALVKPLLKEAGFCFDGNVMPRVWHSQNYFGTEYGKRLRAPRTWAEQVAVVAKFTDYLDENAKALFFGDAAGQAAVAKEILKKESLQTSRATDAEIEIPRPEGLEYLPYQKAGIAYALQRKDTLIADEMGLGKTIQAIGVANAVADAKHMLIICPAKLKLNWMKEFLK